MDFFFFVISFNQSFFLLVPLSLTSLPACLRAPLCACACMGCFSPHSLLFCCALCSYSSEKKTRQNFAFSPCLELLFLLAGTDGLICEADLTNIHFSSRHLSAFPFANLAAADDVCCKPERIFYTHLNEFICCSFSFAANVFVVPNFFQLRLSWCTC